MRKSVRAPKHTPGGLLPIAYLQNLVNEKFRRGTPTANQGRRADGRRREVDNAMQCNTMQWTTDNEAGMLEWRGKHRKHASGTEL